MHITPPRAITDRTNSAETPHIGVKATTRGQDDDFPVMSVVRLAEPASPSRLYYRLGASRAETTDAAPPETPSEIRAVRASLTSAERRALLEYLRSPQPEVNAYLRARAPQSTPTP